MKKIFVTAGIIAVFPLMSFSQSLTAPVDKGHQFTTISDATPSRDILARKRAENNFTRSNLNVENVRWYSDPKGYFVYYTLDGNRGRRFYNKKGRFMYDAISYPEKFLSPELKDRVKSVYYNDYRITNVTEIHGDGKVVHLIQITDGRSWKKLQLANGEMELVEEFAAR